MAVVKVGGKALVPKWRRVRRPLTSTAKLVLFALRRAGGELSDVDLRRILRPGSPGKPSLATPQGIDLALYSLRARGRVVQRDGLIRVVPKLRKGGTK